MVSPAQDPSVLQDLTLISGPSLPVPETVASLSLQGFRKTLSIATDPSPSVNLNRSGNLAVITTPSSIVIVENNSDKGGRFVWKQDTSGPGAFGLDDRHFFVLASDGFKALGRFDPLAFVGESKDPARQKMEFRPHFAPLGFVTPGARFIFGAFETIDPKGSGSVLPFAAAHSINVNCTNFSVRSSSPFQLPGKATAATVDEQGESGAIGIQLESGDFGLFVTNGSQSGAYFTGTSCEITKTAFNPNGRLIFAGDEQGRVTVYRRDGKPQEEKPGTLNSDYRCSIYGSRITAIAALGNSGTFIAATQNGDIFMANVSGTSKERFFRSLGKVSGDFVCSIAVDSFCSSVILGLAQGGAAGFRIVRVASKPPSLRGTGLNFPLQT